MKYEVYIGWLNYQNMITSADVVAQFCSIQRAEEYAKMCNEQDKGKDVYYWVEEV